MTTTRRQQGGHDASFSSSFFSLRHKDVTRAYAPASYSPTQIVEEWKHIFGPGSDLFEPGDPRGILGGITPLEVRKQLDFQTAEIEKLRAEVVEMRRCVHKEQQELKSQVIFFAAKARAAARQAKSEGTDSLTLQKKAHERELARLREAHEYEITAWRDRVEALEREQQQQQPSFPIPPPSSSGRPQSSSARLQSTSSSSPSRRPFGSTQIPATSICEKEGQQTCRSAYKAVGRREDKEEEEEAPRALPLPIRFPNFPVQSTEEQALLEKRLADFEELYEVTRLAMQATAMTTSAAAAAAAAALPPPPPAAVAAAAVSVGGRKGREGKEGSAESQNKIDFTLGSVDVYPGQTAPRTDGIGEGKVGGGSGGGGRGRGRIPPILPRATTHQRKKKTMTAQQGRRSATSTTKSNTFGDRAFARLDPTQYPTSGVSNPPMLPPTREPNDGAGVQEPRDIRGIFKPLMTAEQKERDKREEEEEEEDESEEEEVGDVEGEESVNEEKGSLEEMESSEGEEEESGDSERGDYDCDHDDDDEEEEYESENETESEEEDWLENE